MTTTLTESTTIPPKPIGSTWTDDQWRAIVTGGSNILVAAAAGSGKTAVLVERIIRKISADTDVDRLLVATFTKAAAAEMKERIRIALEKELDRHPGSDHLRRQLALMGRASITTLHSFCLDVIRRYYSLIGLDPGFRIANETEAELLRIDVLDALFEERYGEPESEEGQAFLQLVDKFGGERGDEPLYALVMKLYHFSQSHPWPKVWLEETANAFQVRDAEELSQTEWVASLTDAVSLSLQGAVSLLEQAEALTYQPGGPDAYGETFRDDLVLVRSLLQRVESQPWTTWHEGFTTASFGKLKSQRGDACDKALQEQVKDLRDRAKTIIADLTEELFTRTPEEFAAELAEMAPLMKTLASLADQFGSRFEAAKLEKGLIDFGDMEHYCLRILRDSESTAEALVPSAAAIEYQQQFQEILLDEYQDTNMVQEAIVSLISRSGRGNRFMVGDVKQSIYRFRLAEPGLFLRKYKSYHMAGEVDAAASEIVPDEQGSGEFGVRIDLARNFRSRQEVVDGVNNVFRAIMREKAAEMDYDARAELVCGATYPSSSEGGPAERYSVELAVLDRGKGEAADHSTEAQEETESDGEGMSQAESAEDLQTVQLEARYIASQIVRLKGMQADAANAEPFEVYDGKKGRKRPLAWRDIVILLRADKQWAPVIIEELQHHGIPAYAELSSGYFEATEVETMLSLLRVIDNPYQDIPLAGTLRSPLVGLTGEELALIRIAAGRVSYFEAVRNAADDSAIPEDTQRKLQNFLVTLEVWRGEARQGSLADLLWRIYRETGYYDLAGGMTGGLQRQANLRALHDRARQYEATTLRGLFRFLRFIDRMRESGGDLGTARALGEQEDVVRIMSIHKSKGLEFPVVFAAGLGKQFNKRDLSSPFLMHKQLGFGPRYVDTELRVSYPTLPQLAIKQRLAMETLAEEMRILYVALTRPKEKMFLVGTVADAAKQLQRWESALDADGGLADFRIAGASRFLDWLGPLAMGAGIPTVMVSETDETMVVSEGTEVGEGDARAEGTEDFDTSGAMHESEDARTTDRAAEDDTKVISFRDWRTAVVPASVLGLEAAAGTVEESEEAAAFAVRMQAVQELVPLPESPEAAAEIDRRLSWQYPYTAATMTAAKTSVTEMKRLHAEAGMDEAAFLLPELSGDDGLAGWGSAGEAVVHEGASEVESVQSSLAGVGIEEQVEFLFDEETESLVHEEPKARRQVEETLDKGQESGHSDYTFRLRRPKFMEETALTPAERGMVSHLVMQHIQLADEISEETVRGTVASLRERNMLSAQQAAAVDITGSAAFFQSDVGLRLLRAQWVRRETPFSCTFPADRVYPNASHVLSDEPILIQGVIDCLFQDEEGRLVLLDYKTDRITMKRWTEAAERHRFQLTLYAEAIQSIIGRKIDECYVFFFDGGEAVKLF
ncbi:helicase-exonuclease AddAB subunit AddA [Paenibacillus sp. CF384]|uniref:helicase-exonuclease AddAB subunit AddA n=1 Tax=Paenibacillus sp. CF384 TaxID=1884382 RepID=UPI000899C539|nr:helicase-exonuclease AddAB subunit AddA [Paenibacillus sp. CF384]SDW88746.1 DNA helicase/exodeoxyribonuclease V, subunit A [Paenibacillus sp. CF384]